MIFFGTPPFAVTILRRLMEAGEKIALVVTQPDRPAGRGQKLSEGAVKAFCVEKGLPFLQPRKLRDDGFLEKLRTTDRDLYVVAAYGRILPPALLEIPKLILNVHASLLPRWRGAAPVEHAILSGDAETGVSIMRLVEEMDAGDVLLMKSTPIGPEETGGEVEARLATLGADALLEAIDSVRHGRAHFSKQDSAKVTFAPPIRSEACAIDWAKAAGEIHNQVRAFQPRFGAFTRDGSRRIKVHRTARTPLDRAATDVGALSAESGRLWVRCGDGWLEILELQREGKARQPARAFLAGYPMPSGKRWG